MSNIQSARGSNVPTFTPAGSKGDGGGNGGGGMYFGGGYEEEQYLDYQEDYSGNADLDAIPYNRPVPMPMTKALEIWKTALANQLYEGIHRIGIGEDDPSPY